MEIKEYKSYAEMEAAHQKEVNDFPMCWMFGIKSEEEIKEAIKSSLGADSLSECIGNGAGGLILAADKDKYLAMFARQKEEKELFAKNAKNLEEMILREMNNHEYSYTQNPHDTLLALGRSFKDFDTDKVFSKAWAKAQKICFA